MLALLPISKIPYFHPLNRFLMYPLTRCIAFVALLITVPATCLFAQQKTSDADIEAIRTAYKKYFCAAKDIEISLIAQFGR